MQQIELPEIPNWKLAEHLREISYYYSLERDTYRNKVFAEAAQKIELYPEAITSGKDAKKKIGAGIGDSIMGVIDEFLATDTSQRLTQLKEKYKEREDVIDLFKTIHGIGPVTANKFYDAGYRNFTDLWNSGQLTAGQELAILYRDHTKLRIPRNEIAFIDQALHQFFPGLELVIAGSYRRGEPDSGDIDVLIKQSGYVDLQQIVDDLKARNLLVGDFAQGQVKYLGLLQLPNRPARRLDIVLIKPESWATALLYSTGSQRFNILMRQRAKDLGLRLNEHGLFDAAKNNLVNARTREEDVFTILGLKYVPPVERTRNIDHLEVLDYGSRLETPIALTFLEHGPKH